MDQLTAMRVFVEAVERGSLTSAAERLGLSRAKTSRYLAFLEHLLGARLLHRSTRSLSLTGEGELALSDCRQMLDVQERMLAKRHDHASEPKGELRITCSQSFSQSYLANVIAEYALRYPQVSIDIQLLERSVNLVEERIDLAIRMTNTLDPGTIAKPLGVCRSVICASPAYLDARGRPGSPQELLSHACLTHAQFETHSWRFQSMPHDEWIKVPIKGQIRANDVTVLKQAALAGVGIAMLPTYLVRGEIVSGQLEAVLADWPLQQLGIHAVYTSRQYMPAALRTLLDFLEMKFNTDAFWQNNEA